MQLASKLTYGMAAATKKTCATCQCCGLSNHKMKIDQPRMVMNKSTPLSTLEPNPKSISNPIKPTRPFMCLFG